MKPSQPTITLTLTAQEEQHFVQLMDAALRHGGAGILDVAVLFRGKIITAHQERERDAILASAPVSPSKSALSSADSHNKTISVVSERTEKLDKPIVK